jgi:hypothetical protein
MTYKVVSHFLNALIEDQLSLENVLTPELMEKIKDSIISRGLAYDKHENENKVYFDKELEQLFDEKTKKIIEKLFESKMTFHKRKIFKVRFAENRRISKKSSKSDGQK